MYLYTKQSVLPILSGSSATHLLLRAFKHISWQDLIVSPPLLPGTFGLAAIFWAFWRDFTVENSQSTPTLGHVGEQSKSLSLKVASVVATKHKMPSCQVIVKLR